MGNSQTALQGIHPFKDTSSTTPPPTPFIPPILIPNLTLPELPIILPPSNISTTTQPQQLTLAPTGWSSITSDPQPEKFDDLFVVKPPTPPPRRISYNEQGKPNARVAKHGFLHRGFTSLRTLPRMIRRPDIAKIRGFFKKKRVVGEVYPVPPDAEKPSSPSKPEVFHEQDEYFLLRWDPPAYDGGLPIIGYIIQHLELGLPQPDPTLEKDDTQSWFSSEPGQVTSTEVLLNNLIPGTTYQFRIIAENLLGFSQPSDLSKPIVFNPNGELDDWFCPPVIITPLNETYSVIEHERLVLTIEVTGQPYPIIKWYGGDGVELGKGLDPIKYSVVSCGQRRVLTIHSVDCGDSGVMRCVGENERGVVECSCVVVVEAPPHIHRVLRSELIKLENPYELNKDEERLVRRQDKHDDEMIFQSGELARFKFLYSGSPSPNVCVYHEGDLVDGEEVVGRSGRVFHERVTTEITDNLITVKIASVKRTDRGEWMVRLDNVLGEDCSSVVVTVTDRPSEPGKPDVLQLSDNTVILKWDKPFDDGGCPVAGYVVEYFRSEWGVWLKACTTKNPYTKIRDLIPGSKYKFRVKAENLYGMSGPSNESVEILITDMASTLRSVGGGDGEGTLLMKTVVEEEEDAVKIEEEKPRSNQGSCVSLNRVSAGTMTDLRAIGGGGGVDVGVGGDEESTNQPTNQTLPTTTITHPRTPSPAKLLQVTLQSVVIVDQDPDYTAEQEDEFLELPLSQHHRSTSPHRSPRRSPSPSHRAPRSPRRSPSPSRVPHVSPHVSPPPSPKPPPRISRMNVQQPQIVDEEAIALTRSQEFSVYGGQAQHVPVPPRRHVQGSSPGAQPIMSRTQDSEPQKKLYSRSEIIKSAATNELDYYYSSLTEDTPAPLEEDDHHEYPEEDPELLKVKEALSKDDHLFDDLEDEDDEYEYDFEKLQEEYEEDKKRGVVSRQDSGVSAKSVSRGESYEVEEEEGVEEGRRSVMSDVVGRKKVVRGGSFERAQSEVARDRPVFDFGGSRGVGSLEVEEEVEEVVPEVEVRARSPEVVRGFGAQPPRGGGGGSKTMLHDRFTDYIAMKASSRNKAVGSSLRSLNSSRYSSSENVGGGSRDSGRSSMQQQEQAPDGKVKFVWREFNPEVEREGVSRLERSTSSGGKGLSGFVCQQTFLGTRDEGGGGMSGGGVVEMMSEEEQRGGGEEDTGDVVWKTCACVSTPEIYVRGGGGGGGCGGRGFDGFGVLEHSRSEGEVGGASVPDSGLKERVLGHVPGGVDYETEEESVGGGGEVGLSGISEEEGVSSGGVDREVPRDREVRGRLRKKVSFGSSDVEEISWDGGRGDEEGEEGEGEGEEYEEIGDEGEDMGEEMGEEGEEIGDEGEEMGEEGEQEYEDEEQEPLLPNEPGDMQGGEYLEYEDEGADTHAEEYEEYHPGDDEFDEDEVFEMDVEGVDLRVYTDEGEYEDEFGGDPRVYMEEDEGDDSGVVYLVLEEGREGDVFVEGEGSVRDEKLERLLMQVDMFLGEEEEGEREGGWVEEVEGEELKEGEEEEEDRGVLDEHDGEQLREHEHDEVEGELKPNDVEPLVSEQLDYDSSEPKTGEFAEIGEENANEQPSTADVQKHTESSTQEIEAENANDNVDFETELQADIYKSEAPHENVKLQNDFPQTRDQISEEQPTDIPESQQSTQEPSQSTNIEYIEQSESFEEVVTGSIVLSTGFSIGAVCGVQVGGEMEGEESVPVARDYDVVAESGLPELDNQMVQPEIRLTKPVKPPSPQKIIEKHQEPEIQLSEPVKPPSPQKIEKQKQPEIQSREIVKQPQKIVEKPKQPEIQLSEPVQQPSPQKIVQKHPEPEPQLTELESLYKHLENPEPSRDKPIAPPRSPVHSRKLKHKTEVSGEPRAIVHDIPPPEPPLPQPRVKDTKPILKPPIISTPQPQITKKLTQLEIDNNSTESITPPPPPPRPQTFSYSSYMAEKAKTPPQQFQAHYHGRSSSTTRATSISSLPPVKEEEPAHHSTSVTPQPYKPNMSVYFDVRSSRSPSLLRSPSSARSSTTSLAQDVRTHSFFRSPTEDSDPPITIEEIRNRIEQQRLEMLAPLRNKKEETEERPVVKKKPPPVLQEEPVSPFMMYLFNAAFYLMLSPMLMFVDSLYFGLLCLLVVACVHFFIIRGL